MGNSELTKALVNQLVSPILEVLSKNNARIITLEQPVEFEAYMHERDYGRDYTYVEILTKSGFVSNEELIDIEEGKIILPNIPVEDAYEKMAAAYETLSFETLAEVLNEIRLGNFKCS